MNMYERNTDVNLDFTELVVLNTMLNNYIDYGKSDDDILKLKLKLSQAIYNVTRQEYRQDKRTIKRINGDD